MPAPINPPPKVARVLYLPYDVSKSYPLTNSFPAINPPNPPIAIEAQYASIAWFSRNKN